ncbi:transposase, partial [Geitlerinema sp. P-1104]|uniref:transposase n=1 Tax=Geitlerinema sp. P-1104 TaxID=2546230 RepID=UPI00198110F3
MGEPPLSSTQEGLFRLSRQVKGSNRRHQTRLRLAKLHLKLASTRKDFLHKITTRLIHENQGVCL